MAEEKAPETTPVEEPKNETVKQDGKKPPVLIIVIALLVAVVGFLAYTKVSGKFLFKKTITKDGVTYTTDGKETTLSTKEGNLTVGDNVSLPKDFPKDIPVHPKGKITLVTSKTPEATMITQEIKSSLEDVKAWFKSESQKKGWKIWADDPELLTLTNEKYGASVSFTKVDGNIQTIFSTMKLEEVKNLTGIDPNKTSSQELQNQILNGSLQELQNGEQSTEE